MAHIIGTEQADFFGGGQEDDWLEGLGGNDVIYGGSGNDLMDGGTGSDALVGGEGDDTYLYRAGDGYDIIHDLADTTGGNRLVFTDWASEDVRLRYEYDFDNNEYLVLYTASANNYVRLANFSHVDVFGAHAVQAYEFAGGAVLSYEQLLERGFDFPSIGVQINTGTNTQDRMWSAGLDTLHGLGGNDLLFGGYWQTTLHGDEGDDHLYSGQRNDLLYGGTGGDTYHFDRLSDNDTILELQENAGDVDTLHFGTNIAPQDLIVTQKLNGNLRIDISASAASIEFNDWFNPNIPAHVEQFVFQDGTVLSDQIIEAMIEDAPMVANPIEDRIARYHEQFSFTVPATTFADPDPYDVLTYSASLASGDPLPGWMYFDAATRTFSGIAQDPLGEPFTVRVTATDKYGLSVSEEFDVTVMYDGTINGTEGVDILTGTSGDDVMLGYGGNDFLSGGDGNDRLDGGTGQDTMVGGVGDDYYVVDGIGDSTVENANEGIDTVSSSLNWSLAANVEKLILSGVSAINGNGNELANTITGNSAGNILSGGSGVDLLIGLTGNDVYFVDDAGDVVMEGLGEGLDHVYSSVSYTLSDNVEGLTLLGSSAINATGNALSNVVTGNAGDNVLDGGTGSDVLVGGAGNDTFLINDTSDAVAEQVNGGDSDRVLSSVSYVLGANVENLVLTGAAAINGSGNSLANTITGNAAANSLEGNGGADFLAGGDGNDTYWVRNSEVVISESAGEGTDTVWAFVSYALTPGAHVETMHVWNGSGPITGTGNELDNVIWGSAYGDSLYGLDGNDSLNDNAGDDSLYGGAGNDYLSGWADNDYLDGGAGADVMQGGPGDDTYVVDDALDIVSDFSEGIDHILSSVSYSLAQGRSGVENLTLTGTGDIDGTGNESDNVITGNAGANSLDGQAGADVVAGGDGNDSLYGGGGDTLLGGAGDDSYYIGFPQVNTVIEFEGEGTDTVYALVAPGDGHTLSANFERLFLVMGSVATGNELANEIYGNSEGNILDGGSGADYLLGADGDDIYIVDDAGDVVVEAAGEGRDTVKSSISYTLGSTLEELQLTGTAAIDGTGNDGDNSIYGNSMANVLTGGLGSDYLSGGYGIDTMIGGLGDDLYGVAEPGDIIIENPGAGHERVISTSNYVLADNVEDLSLYGPGLTGTGNALDNTLNSISGGNTLIGAGGNDMFYSYAGSDTLRGGTGDDQYYVDQADDLVVENAGEGNDVVNSSASYALSANVETLRLLGTDALDGTGNSLDNALVGNIGANVLTGGAGNDTYYVGTGDTVVEASGGGTDTVYADNSYVLSANLENLTLFGASALDATGNASNNLLVGNSANNNFNGGGGADTMSGAAGNDSYLVDSASDVIIELASEGADLVQSSIAYTLGANLENLTLIGSGKISGTGNVLNNALTGNAENNTLNGGAGNDTIAGGGGRDSLVGGDGDDVLVWDSADSGFRGEAGSDTLSIIGSGIGIDLTTTPNNLITNVEILDLTGTGNNTLTLALSDLLAISSTTDVLRVDGNAGDMVIAGNGWTQGSDQVIGSNTYHSFTQGLGVLLIDTDVTANVG